MHQQRLHSITRSGIVDLRIDHDSLRHVEVTGLVDVNVTHAVGMAQDRDLGVLLDVRHQGVAAPGDDEVDDVIELRTDGNWGEFDICAYAVAPFPFILDSMHS